MIFLLYGKRKSGKDYFAELIQKHFSNEIKLGRISEPLKTEYAKQHDLNLQELLSNSSYKEKYRKDMVEWGEKMRKIDSGYFCSKLDKSVNFVTDCRRMSDLEFFKEHHSSIYTIKIIADENIRNNRGWIFTKGIDDSETECGLDNVMPDFVVENNNASDANLIDKFKNIYETVNKCNSLK